MENSNKNNNTIKSNTSKSNSGTFMMGIGNGNFNSDKLIEHLKNIETELNQKIVGKSSEYLNHPKNTFNNIINKLKKQVHTLNTQVMNYNKEKQEIVNISNKEVKKLKGIIISIYRIVLILTKSLDVSDEEKKNSLEKLRKTIENSAGFVKSINDIEKYSNKMNKPNIKMTTLLSDININKIAENIGESKEEIQNSSLKNNYILKNNHTNNEHVNNQHANNHINNEHANNHINNEHVNNNHHNNEYKNQITNPNEARNEKIMKMNKYYEHLKTHNDTLLQKKIKNKKLNQNEANKLLENQMSIRT